MRLPRPASRSAQRGFTLLELMIALTIGLLLTLVVAQLFLGSRRAYSTTDALSRMQENMRFAQEVLTRTLHIAGYKSSPNRFSTGPFGVFADPNLALDGGTCSSSCATTPASDELTVRFQGASDAALNPDKTMVDCQGNAVKADEIVTNRFAIVLDKSVNPEALSLACYSSLNGNPNTPVTIVPNVENMQILYGEDLTASPGDATVDQWVNRADVKNINAVVAVRIALLFASPTTGAQNAPDTAAYDLVGTSVPAGTDTKLRRVQTMTIAVRNRTP